MTYPDRISWCNKGGLPGWFRRRLHSQRPDRGGEAIPDGDYGMVPTVRPKVIYGHPMLAFRNVRPVVLHDTARHHTSRVCATTGGQATLGISFVETPFSTERPASAKAPSRLVEPLAAIP